MRPYLLAAPLAFVALALAGCAHTHRPEGVAAPTAALQLGASHPHMPGGYTRMAAAAGAGLYFINLRNGDVVESPLRVQFGLRGMGVAPAGVEKTDTGHHHLLVDVAALDPNVPLPIDAHHRHFGAGQTETMLQLAPGSHTLQLVLGDHNHVPHHPPVLSERITVLVK